MYPNLRRKKRVLVISNWFLFPIRNGMELPVAMHIKWLSSIFDFDFHLVNTKDNIEGEISKRKPLNECYFQSITATVCFRIPARKRILNELLLRKPFYDDLDTMSSLSLDLKKYDCIWVTNAKLGSIIYRLEELGGSNIFLTTNDAIYYFYYERFIASLIGREGKPFRSLLNFFRLPFILLNERAYLMRYAAVHVQTNLEKERLKKILPKSQVDKLCVAPNGIKTELLSISHEASGNTVLLMNHMTDGREQQALWFLNNVWSYVVKAQPSLKLLVVGSLPNNSNDLYVDKFHNVEFTGYVSNLEVIYKSSCISVIPHYQSSGYINRLYDAMSAGVPVIISPQIASTIEEFTSGVHGIVAKNRRELISSIISLSDNNAQQQRTMLAQNARQLVMNSFQWEESTNKIKAIIQKMN